MTALFDVKTLTQSSQLVYTVEIIDCDSEELISYENVGKFSELCKLGCVNYKQKWSCPPYTPLYKDFSVGWEKLFIIYMRIDMSQFSYIKNNYLKIRAANSILKSRADRFLRLMADRYGKFISTGSCRLCKPCKCKSGLICAHPEKMTYSFEALGIDVEKLVVEYFNVPLLWYNQGNLPEYTSVVCGLLSNELHSLETLRDEYMELI